MLKKLPNWSLGFGLENIGLLVLRFPRIATLLLFLSLVVSAMMIPRIGFDGNIVNVLDLKSKAFKNYVIQATKFHDFAGDVSVVVKNEKLLQAETLEGMRNLALDLTLEEGIAGIFSVFSLGDAASESNSTENLLPVEFTSDEQAKSSIENLLKMEPSARSIIAPERKAMVILVQLDAATNKSEAAINAGLAKLKSALSTLGPKGSTYLISGMPQIRTSIVDAIISDQTKLTGFGIALGAFVAWLVFGTVRAALICTIPAFLGVIWTLSTFAASGVSLNFFTTSLPTLALIITFADTIVLYFRWQSLNTQSVDSTLSHETAVENLREAIRQVGPASSLTSITTAIAFGSFSWASTNSMDDLAFFGVATVLFAFLALIIGLPLAGFWASRLMRNSTGGRQPRMMGKGMAIAGLTTRAPQVVAAVSLVLLAVFSWVHTQLKPSYALADYLPYGSEIRASESYVDSVFGGTSQYYVLLPVTKGGVFHDAKNRERIQQLHAEVEQVFGTDKTQSLAAAWKRLDEGQIKELVSTIDDASPALRGRFLAEDRSMVQISASTSAGQNTLAVQAKVKELKQQISNLPFAQEVTVTGLTVLLAEEFPKLIGELRTGLLVSIFLAMVIVALATRNIALALASLVPNLIPILFTETVMWSVGANLSVTNVIALTIAFGIAIDNAVHVINSYTATKGKMGSITADVRSAVGEISPALVASTGIICVATVITQFSSMPSVGELGMLLIATLIVALISNLAILPSMMIVVLKASNRLAGKTEEMGIAA